MYKFYGLFLLFTVSNTLVPEDSLFVRWNAMCKLSFPKSSVFDFWCGLPYKMRSSNPLTPGWMLRGFGFENGLRYSSFLYNSYPNFTIVKSDYSLHDYFLTVDRTLVDFKLPLYDSSCNYVIFNGTYCLPVDGCGDFILFNRPFGIICMVYSNVSLFGIVGSNQTADGLGRFFNLLTLRPFTIPFYLDYFQHAVLDTAFDVHLNSVSLSMDYVYYFSKFFNDLTYVSVLPTNFSSYCTDTTSNGVFGRFNVVSASTSCYFGYPHPGSKYIRHLCGASSVVSLCDIDYPILPNVTLVLRSLSNVCKTKLVSLPTTPFPMLVTSKPSVRRSKCPDCVCNFNNSCPILPSCLKCPDCNVQCSVGNGTFFLDHDSTMDIVHDGLHHFYFLLTGDIAQFKKYSRARRSIASWLGGVLASIVRPFFDVLISVISDILSGIVAFFLDMEPLFEKILLVLEANLETFVGLFMRLISFVFCLVFKFVILIDTQVMFFELMTISAFLHWRFRSILVVLVVVFVLVIIVGFGRPYPSLLGRLHFSAPAFKKLFSPGTMGYNSTHFWVVGDEFNTTRAYTNTETFLKNVKNLINSTATYFNVTREDL